AWAAYYAARSGNALVINQAKARLDTVIRNLYASFGGPEAAINQHIADLRQMAKENPGKEMSAAVDAEVKEIQRYQQQMPKATPVDYAAEVAAARTRLDEAQ